MKKGKGILGSIILVLGLVAIGIGVFLSFETSNKKIFTENLKRNLNAVSLFGNSESTLNKALTKLMEDNAILKVTTDTSMTSVEDGASTTQKLNGDFYLNSDKFYLEMKATGADLPAAVSLKALFKDDRLYHYVENIYSKFYYDDFKMSTFNEVKDNETEEITDAFIEGLIAKIDDSAFTKENAELNLGGKNFVLEKVTVKMTEKEVFEVLMKAYEELNLDTAEIKDMVEEAKNSKNSYVFSIFLDGKDILATHIELSFVDDEGTQKIKVEINSYTNSEGFENNEVILKMSGMELASIKAKGVSATRTDITFDLANMVVIDGYYEETDTKAELVFQGNLGDEKFVLELRLEMIEATDNVSLTMVVEMGDTLKLNSKNRIQVIDTFPEVDVSNAAPSSEMSELEKSIFGLFGEKEDLFY